MSLDNLQARDKFLHIIRDVAKETGRVDAVGKKLGDLEGRTVLKKDCIDAKTLDSLVNMFKEMNYTDQEKGYEDLKVQIEAILESSKFDSVIKLSALEKLMLVLPIQKSRIDSHTRDNETLLQQEEPIKQEKPEEIKAPLIEGDLPIPGDEYGRAPIHRAAAEGDLELLNKLLDEGADIKTSDKNGRTAMHWATAHDGKLECLNRLIKEGADIEAKDEEGMTPLHYASAYGNPNCLEKLIEETIKLGGNINAKDSAGRTALHFAVNKGSLECLIKLIQAKAEINTKDDLGYTPLHIAAKGKLDCLKKLMEEGADTNAKDTKGQIPLHRAAHGYPDCLSLLLEKMSEQGADISAKDTNGQIPLHFAANGYPDCLSLLLEKMREQGANIDVKDLNGNTSLHLTAYIGNLDCLTKLIQAGADVEAKDKNSETTIFFAIRNKHLDCIDQLIKNGANKNVSNNNGLNAAILLDFLPIPGDEYGRSPIHRAAAEGDLTLLRRLLDEGVDIKTKDKNGKTAMHWAAREGKLDCLNRLMKEGANIEAKDENGDTPLHIASACGHLSCQSLLIDKNANIEAKNKSRETPLILAALNGRLECQSQLIEKKANIEAKDETGRTPLHVASINGHFNCLEKLIEEVMKQDKDINAKDKSGMTSLHFAAANGCLDCLNVLIEARANVEVKDMYDQTPIFYAINFEHLDCVDQLIKCGADPNISNKNGRNALTLFKERKSYFKKTKGYFKLKNLELLILSRAAIRQKAISHSWHIKGISEPFKNMRLEASCRDWWLKNICKDFLKFQTEIKTEKHQEILNDANVALVENTIRDFDNENLTNIQILDNIKQGRPVIVRSGCNDEHDIALLFFGDQCVICDGASRTGEGATTLPAMQFFHFENELTLEILEKIQQMGTKGVGDFLAFFDQGGIVKDLGLSKKGLDQKLEETCSLPKQTVGNCGWISSHFAIRAQIALIAARGIENGKLANRSYEPDELEQWIEKAKDCDNDRLAFHQIANLERGLKYIDEKRLDLLDHALIQTALHKAYLLPLDKTLTVKLNKATEKYKEALKGDKLTDFNASLQFFKTQSKGSFTDYGNPELLKLKKISVLSDES